MSPEQRLMLFGLFSDSLTAIKWNPLLERNHSSGNPDPIVAIAICPVIYGPELVPIIIDHIAFMIRNQLISSHDRIKEWPSCQSIALFFIASGTGEHKVPEIVVLDEGPRDEMVDMDSTCYKPATTIETGMGFELIEQNIAVV